MTDYPTECDHEWDEEETGPLDRQGRTAIYAVCTICGEAHQTGVGSVL